MDTISLLVWVFINTALPLLSGAMGLSLLRGQHVSPHQVNGLLSKHVTENHVCYFQKEKVI